MQGGVTEEDFFPPSRHLRMGPTQIRGIDTN